MMHSSMGLAGVQWNMPVLSYLDNTKVSYITRWCYVNILLHHRLLEVNINKVIDNLPSLLYFQLKLRILCKVPQFSALYTN